MGSKEYLIDKMNKLNREIPALKKKLASLPEGYLMYNRNGNSFKWYKLEHKNGKRTRAYIPKRDIEKARQLAQKTYLHRTLLDRQNELTSIEKYLKTRKDHHATDMLETSSPYSNLLLDSGNWENEAYEKSSSHPEALIHKAPKGELVRSKSEAMIARELYERGIQYRYEWVRDYKGVEIASDFTILHPITRKLLVWEHFGMCDDKKYQPSITYKLPIYLDAGYIPGKNLILTFETLKEPLQYEDVVKIIDTLLN
ncbi:MAG: hypothetical protein K6G10_09080 [Butyrivibrio sp.]|nr:hypothetical protein [Butyrivibrio sp.]